MRPDIDWFERKYSFKIPGVSTKRIETVIYFYCLNPQTNEHDAIAAYDKGKDKPAISTKYLDL